MLHKIRCTHIHLSMMECVLKKVIKCVIHHFPIFISHAYLPLLMLVSMYFKYLLITRPYTFLLTAISAIFVHGSKASIFWNPRFTSWTKNQYKHDTEVCSVELVAQYSNFEEIQLVAHMIISKMAMFVSFSVYNNIEYLFVMQIYRIFMLLFLFMLQSCIRGSDQTKIFPVYEYWKANCIPPFYPYLLPHESCPCAYVQYPHIFALFIQFANSFCSNFWAIIRMTYCL